MTGSCMTSAFSFALLVLLQVPAAAIMVSTQWRMKGKDGNSSLQSTGARIACEPSNTSLAPEQSNASNITKELIFLHIPKNAGTAIEDAGSEKNMTWGRNMNFATCEWHDYVVDTHCSQWHVPPRYIRKPVVYSQAYEIFCVVRHPYARALAEYRWEAFQNSWNCTPALLNTFWRQLVSDYQKNRFTRDCHVLPQAEYIWDADGKQICKNIFDMPTLPMTINNFMEFSNYSVRLPVRGESEREYCDNLRPSDFDQDVLAMVNEIYKEDFQKLGWMGFQPHGPVNRNIKAGSLEDSSVLNR